MSNNQTQLLEHPPKTQPALKKASPLALHKFTLALILAYFILNLIVVSPVGNFPLNDDWIYSAAVLNFMQTGSLHTTACTALCPLQILLGAAACLPAGFSHDTLRMLGVFMSLVSTIALYAIMIELRVSRRFATIGALLYACNPIVVNASYSFMTDIGSQMFVMLYGLSFLKGLRKQSYAYLALAALMLTCSIAVRQTNTAYVAANAFILMLLWMRTRRTWSIAAAAVLLVAVPVLSTFAIERLMIGAEKCPEAYLWYKAEFAGVVKQFLKTPLNAGFDLLVQSGKTALYLGLFLLPLAVPFFKTFAEMFRARPKIMPVWFVCSAIALTVALTKLTGVGHALMPYSQNLLRLPILGALTIMGVSIPLLSKQWRALLTNISTFSAFALLTGLLAGCHRSAILAVRYIVRSFKAPMPLQESHAACDRTIPRQDRRSLAITFSFALVAISFAVVAVQTKIDDIDRYYIMVLAPAIVCLCLTLRWLRLKAPTLLVYSFLAMMALYSTCAEQDYMSWNRARWRALANLEKKGVSPKDIDGGSEYNYLRDPELGHCLSLAPGVYNFTHKGVPPRCDWRWWPINGEKYIISFSPVPGYEVIAREPYFSGLSLSTREVLVLRAEK